MTMNSMQKRNDELTETCEGLLTEIRKGDPDTVKLAIEQFGKANAERVKLMGLLNLIPYGQR